MAKSERVLNFRIENTEHLIRIVEGLTKIDADLEADSGPHSIKITVHEPREKIKNTCKKIRSLVEEAKSS